MDSINWINDKILSFKKGQSFCIFFGLISLVFSGFTNAAFFLFPALSLALYIFYSIESSRIAQYENCTDYEEEYYYRYSITVNLVLVIAGILLITTGFISILTISAVIWGLPNLIYFVKKKRSLEKVMQHDDLLDSELTS